MTRRVLCAFARFCDPHGQVWSQVERSDDPEVRSTFVRQVNNCPAGRLVAWDRASGQPIEPELPVSIGLVEDPAENSSGPLWLRGGIPVVSVDGFSYEVRNRHDALPLRGLEEQAVLRRFARHGEVPRPDLILVRLTGAGRPHYPRTRGSTR